MYLLNDCVGTLYSHLAVGTGFVGEAAGGFRALSRGYTHWASGRMDKFEVNYCHPNYCHVRSLMKPSMKQGTYKVYLLLERIVQDFASICIAKCECAAGYV